MIHISNLHFAYPNNSFNLHIEALHINHGEAVAIIGPSGTGKTTLLNLIAGVMKAQAGDITIHKQRLTTMPDEQVRDFRLRTIGMIFQEFELLEYLNVRDNILLPYRMSAALKLDNNVHRKMETLAIKTGIADKLQRPIRHLSQGERQRVAFCRAVLTSPPLLLADEPTGNLDPENTERILDIFFEHVRTMGATLVVVSHDQNHLDRFDRILDFNDYRKKVNTHG